MTTTIVPGSDWFSVYWVEKEGPNGQDDQIALVFSRIAFFQVIVTEGSEPKVLGFDALDGRIGEQCERAHNHLGYLHATDRHNPETIKMFRERALRKQAADRATWGNLLEVES